MQILESKTIYRDNEYVAFPNLARLPDGTIICAFRHAKNRLEEYGKFTHIDPTAKDVFIKSPDGGLTFDTTLNLILDDEMSDQDPCVNVLSDGRIIVTYFRWNLAPMGKGPELWGEQAFRDFGREEVLNRYCAFPDGASYSISDDNGKTWRHMPQLIVEGAPSGIAVRGNIVELPDGTLLLPYYGSLKLGQLSSCGLLRSLDRGESWNPYSIMAFDPECNKTFVEPNLYRTESGRLIGLYRTQSDYQAARRAGIPFDDTYLNLHISVSDDDGKTFGPLQEIENCWSSNPFHALRLKSGKVLLTYGYRRKPFGIRARLCNAELTDICEAEELILRDDSATGDAGYPHAIQLDNGDILVAYYIVSPDLTRTIDVTVLRED